MSEQEIISGNKLIKEFMQGYKFKDTTAHREYIEHNLKYHTSWKALVEAWARFYKEALDFAVVNFEFMKQLSKFRELYCAGVVMGNNKNAHEALVNAIKWYNENKT